MLSLHGFSAAFLLDRPMSLQRIPLKNVVVLGFMLLYLGTGLLAYDDYGISTDEFVQRQHALVSMKYLLDLLQLHELAAHARFANLPALADYAHQSYGVVFHMPLMVLEMLFDLDHEQSILWRMRHLYTFIWFFTGSLFFYALLNQLYGWRLALVGWLMLVLSPRIFANSFYNVKDTAFLAVVCFVLYAALRFLRRQTLLDALLLALATAIAINVRFAGVMLLAFVFLVITLDWCFARTWPTRRALGTLVLLAGLTALLVLALWPAAWRNTVSFLIDTFVLSTNYTKWKGTTVFLGTLIQDSMTPWNYISVWMLLTTPLSYTLLFGVGLWAAAHRFLRADGWDQAWLGSREQVFFMLVLFVPLVLVVALNSTLYGDWRHLYFVYPALLTLAVGGLQAAMQQRQVWYQAGRAWMARLCTVLLLACMGHMAFTGSWICRNHPHQQVYFNALAGQHVAKRFDRDIWGLSARDGIEFILLHDSRQHIRVSGDHVIQNLRMLDAVSRARIEPVLRSDEWDYEVVTYRNVIGDLSEPPFWTPFYTVEVDGTPIMTVIRSNRNSVTKSVVP